ncbi:hypothetical protein K439DRAFT_1662613 [Ramaria rubella]|nr:hypothetical protein K439DRAFT_1662613 [Ramaria rubella]
MPENLIHDCAIEGANSLRFRQAEKDLLFALEAQHLAESDDLTPELTTELNRLRLNCETARESYKTELWNYEFEPVLQRIKAEAVKEDTRAEVIRQLEGLKESCWAVVRTEGDVLHALSDECDQIRQLSHDAMLVLRSSSARRVATNTEKSTDGTQNGSRRIGQGDQEYDMQAHCDHLFAALEDLRKSDSDSSSSISYNAESEATITQLRAVVNDLIAAAKLRAEHAALWTSMVHERALLADKTAEMQRCNEENLSTAAKFLIEASEVEARAYSLRAAAQADGAVTIKILEEIARREAAVQG